MLICINCGKPISETAIEDGHMCFECGRVQLCEECALIGGHTCDPPPFWVAQEDEDEEVEYDPPDGWLEEPPGG
ncbi:MAG TPA: hypothetical protein VKF17_16690 [Isosphaeraceae bacterium]|nr:hypothetical protein [Isosphaeraceae bacterium]